MKKKLIIILLVAAIAYYMFYTNQNTESESDKNADNPASPYNRIPHETVKQQMKESYAEYKGIATSQVKDSPAYEAVDYGYAEYVLKNFPYTRTSTICDENGEEIDYDALTMKVDKYEYNYKTLATFLSKKKCFTWATDYAYSREYIAISFISLLDWPMFEKVLKKTDDNFSNWHERWEAMKKGSAQPKQIPVRTSPTSFVTNKQRGTYAIKMLESGMFQRLERRAELSKQLYSNI